MNQESKDCGEFPDFFFGSLVVGFFQTGSPPHMQGSSEHGILELAKFDTSTAEELMEGEHHSQPCDP